METPEIEPQKIEPEAAALLTSDQLERRMATPVFGDLHLSAEHRPRLRVEVSWKSRPPG